MARNLLKAWPALWTFAERPGVAPTNNHAERALRGAVIYRRLFARQPIGRWQARLEPGCSPHTPRACCSTAPCLATSPTRSPPTRVAIQFRCSPEGAWGTERLRVVVTVQSGQGDIAQNASNLEAVERAEAEAIYDAGHEAVVEVLLADGSAYPAARGPPHEKLERPAGAVNSRNSSRTAELRSAGLCHGHVGARIDRAASRVPSPGMRVTAVSCCWKHRGWSMRSSSTGQIPL